MNYKSILVTLILALGLMKSQAQTVSSFESYAVTDTFINGSSNPLGYTFVDGNVAFENYYDTSFGGYWSGGFAISGVKDSTTNGFGNLYGCFPAEGQGGSNNYAMSNNYSKAILQGNASGRMLDGVHIANSTFAVRSMQNGDNFAKKFGGPTGNDPDWFKLEIFGQTGGIFTTSVEFYLADYRFSDNTQDYIVKDWQWVDLKPLGDVDTLLFFLSSSDTNQYGIKTPAFFAIDNLTTLDGLSLSEGAGANLSVFPNPVNNLLFFKGLVENSMVNIFDVGGKIVWKGKTPENGLDVSEWKKGLYFFKTDNGTHPISGRFIVE